MFYFWPSVGIAILNIKSFKKFLDLDGDSDYRKRAVDCFWGHIQKVSSKNTVQNFGSGCNRDLGRHQNQVDCCLVKKFCQNLFITLSNLAGKNNLLPLMDLMMILTTLVDWFTD